MYIYVYRFKLIHFTIATDPATCDLLHGLSVGGSCGAGEGAIDLHIYIYTFSATSRGRAHIQMTPAWEGGSLKIQPFESA